MRAKEKKEDEAEESGKTWTWRDEHVFLSFLSAVFFYPFFWELIAGYVYRRARTSGGRRTRRRTRRRKEEEGEEGMFPPPPPTQQNWVCDVGG